MISTDSSSASKGPTVPTIRRTNDQGIEGSHCSTREMFIKILDIVDILITNWKMDWETFVTVDSQYVRIFHCLQVFTGFQGCSYATTHSSFYREK